MARDLRTFLCRSQPALLLAGVLLILALGACKEKAVPPDPARPVRAMRVAGPDEFMQRSFPGLASASTEVNLAFRVGGPLISRSVDVGDMVEAGDIGALIAPRGVEGTSEGGA